MKEIVLTNQGGAKYDVDFGIGIYSLVLKYNYRAACWSMDIIDSSGDMVLSGLMLVPDVDILYPYPDVSETLGSLIVREKNADDYQNPDLLGTNVKLTWQSTSELGLA